MQSGRRTRYVRRLLLRPSRIELPVGAMMGPVVGAEGVPPALKNGFKTAIKALFLLLLKPPRTMKAPQNYPAITPTRHDNHRAYLVTSPEHAL